MTRLFKRKLATAVLVTVSVAAFATLGDGGKNNAKNKSLLSNKASNLNYRNFSLKSGYNYRGSTVISNPQQDKYIMLNTVVPLEKGNTTYLLPIRKKVLLDKIKFSPSATPRY